jgi:hypothetical protein
LSFEHEKESDVVFLLVHPGEYHEEESISSVRGVSLTPTSFDDLDEIDMENLADD